MYASFADALAATLLSPTYAAVIEWFPVFSADVENVATPFTSAAVPIGVLPSLNCTDPVAAAGVTVAVNVTVWPTLAWSAGVAEMVVVDAACAIISLTAGDVLPAKVASPPYTAVSVCGPTVRFVKPRKACPLTIIADPSSTVPSKYCTLPDASGGVTVAVSDTWPVKT